LTCIRSFSTSGADWAVMWGFSGDKKINEININHFGIQTRSRSLRNGKMRFIF